MGKGMELAGKGEGQSWVLRKRCYQLKNVQVLAQKTKEKYQLFTCSVFWFH